MVVNIFDNRILRRISRSEKDENWKRRILYKEKLQSSYCSTIIVRVIKSRRLVWAGHVARMEEGYNSS
jgi:hypothetical protein